VPGLASGSLLSRKGSFMALKTFAMNGVVLYASRNG